MSMSTYIVVSDDKATFGDFVMCAPMSVVRDFLLLQPMGEKRVLRDMSLLGVARFHCSIRNKSYVMKPGPEVLTVEDLRRGFNVAH